MTWSICVIALAGSISALLMSPVAGLLSYYGVLIWYPYDVTVKLGTADFSASRIVILVVLIRLLFRKKDLEKFRLITLDKLVLLFFVCQLAAGIFTSPSYFDFLENRFGSFLDLILPYFAARIILNSKSRYLLFLKYVLVLSLPLAFLGIYQTITGYNIFASLRTNYSSWGIYRIDTRYGFHRAHVSFPVHIMFGLFFVQIGSLCTGMIFQLRRNRGFYVAGILLLIIGIISSVSSGPFLALILTLLFLVFFPLRKYWKPVILMIVLMCGSVEIISNRHFYDVLGDFTMNPSTAWYRSRLMDIALFEGGMSGHWLFGYGYETDPGWGKKIDSRDHTDIVNYYILILSRHGLLGLLSFLFVAAAAIKRLIIAFRSTAYFPDQWLIWSVASGLFMLCIVFFTVGLLGPPETIFFIMLAICGNMPFLCAQKRMVKGSLCQKTAVHGQI